MSYLNWKVGDKIVCIDGRWPAPPEGWGATIFPQANRVYTIRSLYPYGPKLFVRLQEIKNELVSTDIGPFEAAFGARHFRSVQTRKTDISILKSILLNPHIPVREDA